MKILFHIAGEASCILINDIVAEYIQGESSTLIVFSVRLYLIKRQHPPTQCVDEK